MELIGAGFDNRIQDAARVAAVFGINRAVDEVELIDGIRAGRQPHRVQAIVHRIGAIQEERILLALAPVDGIVVAIGVALADSAWH